MVAVEHLRSALAHPLVRAFLRVIRAGESTQDDDAYRLRYHPTKYPTYFDGFDDHPRIFEPLPDGSGRKSSAAGAYQITATTWDGLVAQYGFKDFTPFTQDQAAVALLYERGAIDPLLHGNFYEALAKAGPVWASLPGSSLQDGGSKMAMKRAEEVFARYGGGEPRPEDITQPAAPIEDRSTPARQEDVDRINTEERMAFPILPIIAALGEVIPSIAALFGKDGEKVAAKTAAATKVIEVVTNAVGAVNGQDAVEKLAADPEKLAVAKAALYSDPTIGGMLMEVGGGIAAAHQRAIDPAQPALYKNPAFWISLLLMPMAYYVVVAVIGVPWNGQMLAADVSQEVRSMVIGGIMGTVLGGIVAFWLGTSWGSARKTDLIAGR